MKKVCLMVIGLLSLSYTYSQSTDYKNTQTVSQFLAGFNDPSKIQEALSLLATDYHFQNPMVELHSKAEFIALAQEIGKVLTGVEIIRIAAQGEWVPA